MSTKLHQIQLAYDATQDRLILTLLTNDFNEFRFWITRRMVAQLIKLLKEQLAQISDPSTSISEREKASKQIQKETRNPTTSQYKTNISRHPLGEEPLLLRQFAIKGSPEGQIGVRLEAFTGQSIEFTSDASTIYALQELILKTVPQTEWGLA